MNGFQSVLRNSCPNSVNIKYRFLGKPFVTSDLCVYVSNLFRGNRGLPLCIQRCVKRKDAEHGNFLLVLRSKKKKTVPNTAQGHPTDRFGGTSVRKTCNRLKFSVREISSRAFLINAFCFRRDKMTFWTQK